MSRPVRIQRKRTAGWHMPTNTVYVGRPTRWGNPFIIGQEYVRGRMEPGGGQKSGACATPEQAVRLFKRFTARETSYRVEAFRHLRGKNLACWCALDDPCHADVLLKIANAAPEQSGESQ